MRFSQKKIHEADNFENRMDMLIKLAGFTDDECKMVMASYKKPKPAAEAKEKKVDEDLQGLVDELVVDMDANVQDLKQWRGELQKRHIKQLAKKREKAREVRSQKRAARMMKRKEASKKVRESALNKFFGGKRRRSSGFPAPKRSKLPSSRACTTGSPSASGSA